MKVKDAEKKSVYRGGAKYFQMEREREKIYMIVCIKRSEKVCDCLYKRSENVCVCVFEREIASNK